MVPTTIIWLGEMPHFAPPSPGKTPSDGWYSESAGGSEKESGEWGINCFQEYNKPLSNSGHIRRKCSLEYGRYWLMRKEHTGGIIRDIKAARLGWKTLIHTGKKAGGVIPRRRGFRASEKRTLALLDAYVREGPAIRLGQ